MIWMHDTVLVFACLMFYQLIPFVASKSLLTLFHLSRLWIAYKAYILPRTLLIFGIMYHSVPLRPLNSFESPCLLAPQVRLPSWPLLLFPNGSIPARSSNSIFLYWCACLGPAPTSLDWLLVTVESASPSLRSWMSVDFSFQFYCAFLVGLQVDEVSALRLFDRRWWFILPLFPLPQQRWCGWSHKCLLDCVPFKYNNSMGASNNFD